MLLYVKSTHIYFLTFHALICVKSKIIKNTSQKQGLKIDPWSKKEEDHAEQYLAFNAKYCS